ncbi:MAG: hypothetical protein HYZ14_05235 [Bacteroidetes bacterium]|nr:hypothetical protein [Bacteroidota bacterium]
MIIFLGTIWIVFSTGGVILSLIAAIPLYFGAISVFSRRTFFDDQFVRKIPFHFRRSKRNQTCIYKNLARVKLSYISGKYSNHFVEFYLKDQTTLTMVVFENQHTKLLQLLELFIEKRIPVFVSNETTFLVKMNQQLKKVCGSEISYSDKVTLQHTFFYLKDQESDTDQKY